MVCGKGEINTLKDKRKFWESQLLEIGNTKSNLETELNETRDRLFEVESILCSEGEAAQDATLWGLRE